MSYKANANRRRLIQIHDKRTECLEKMKHKKHNSYQPFEACSVFMGAGVSIVSLVDLRFSYPSKCIHTLI